MAAVLEPKDAAAKHNSQVDEQIAQATSRIRTHDLAFGGLTLAALVLIYATAMICLDRYLNLPEWVRQVSLFGFFGLLAGTAYLTLLSPLRKRINPLYAAKQVERTIDDPKNSVTGYVDAREKGDLNATVKAALASKAAKAAAEADVNKAVDHRSLAYLGGVTIAFLLTLIVLFFVFRPAPFASLVGRTFAPFSSGEIVRRTQLTLVKPDPADATVTIGQTITVSVYVGGKVPKADRPDKVRLLVRHNLADPNYDELPMVQGDTSRDWELRVPDYLVQNGFWYKVAGGDDVTPEHKVTVRSLPMFTSFQATYEYPKYLRRKNDTTDDPVLKAYRGTTVTLVAKANRDVRDGLMEIAPGNSRVAGTPVPGQPDSLQFVFKLAESGKYKLWFTATNGERTIDPFQGVITVEQDNAPQIVINKPEEDETAEPANGIVKIDGKVGDDFGIDTVTLKTRIVSPVERPLADKPYLNGKITSFRRDKDGTYPTDLDYKDSIDLASLRKDAAGLELQLTADMVIEYWLEATDNCTEPKPNVGVSGKKRVRLTPPKVEEMEKQNLDKQKEQRKDEEKKHNDNQQQKLDKEKREPQKGGEKGDQGKQPDSKPGDKGDKGTEPQPPMGGMPENPPKEPNAGDPKTDMPKADGMGTDKGGTPPKTDAKPGGKNDTKGGNANQDIDKVAKDFQDDLKRENQDGGEPKPNNTPPEQERTDPAQPKPQPKDGMMGMGNAADPKPAPKEQNDPANPMGKQGAPPSETKPEGDLQKPQDPATPKPEPKQGDKGGKNNTAPSESRSEPFGSSPGTEKPQPKDPQPQPKDPNAKQDPNSGSTAKAATEKKDGDPAGMPNSPDKKADPAADAGSQPKPMQEPKRGDDKPPQPQPKGAPPKDPPGTAPKQPDPKSGEPDAGDGKADKATPPAGTKPPPKDGTPKGMDPEAKPAPGANDPMAKPNATNAAEARPDDAKKDKGPTAGEKSVEKGIDKPQPQPQAKDKGDAGNKAPMPKEKIDEQQRKELEQAARDLAGDDEAKKQAAREKLDKAVGEQKRKELEKLANDLKSPDEKTRADAQQKVKDMMEKAKGDKKDDTTAGSPKKDEPKELTPEQKKEIEKALDELQSNDPDRKRQAQEKLDKMVGQENRKEAEQLMKDLQSDDKAKQEAAKKKLNDIEKDLDDKVGGKGGANDSKKGINDAKGKEPTPEDINDLLKKAQDLQSKDEGKRQQAQKELDEKFGKEQREKLEEMMKNQKPGNPMDAEKLKKQLEELAKNQPKKPDTDFKPMGLGSSPPAKGPMEDDLNNRLKATELMLEQLQKEENRKRLQNKQGWTDAEIEKFIKDSKEHADDLRKQLEKEREKPVAPGPKEVGAPINASGGGKVEGMGGASGAATGGGATTAPPGFEKTREKFEKALPKKP